MPRASFPLSELRARNSSSPHESVVLPPLSSLGPCRRSLRPPRAPTSPRDARPPPASAAFSSPPSQAATWSTRGSGTTATPATAFPDHPRHIPCGGSCSPRRRSPPDPALRAPQRRRRRLPVTPLPPASCRHRLPQQPANCSATTSLPIGRVHALKTASLIGWSMFAARPSVRRLRIPASEQGKHRLCPAIPSCTMILTSVRPPMHRCAEKKCRTPHPSRFPLPSVHESVARCGTVERFSCFPAERHSERLLPFPLGSGWRIDS
ncbi:NADH dehydrogenase [ubiquinone] 1 beta subcomplex subunit 3 isoform X1 [Canis lupus familiaris]|uniref:NADH dehydrogenase [ubiquinone] 1 beta subcomplex subunit 3 isoform X1 n=1 Tax=Canis lupus familiaris TaxID=9615 RepID=UPI0018F70D77|nr:NADH dehydrogenase [ubiquinone] 1 beta subcomplex subunit 3 isoform X1 [Canis lupus familiaris]XP_038319439.1 NADH dehydrogenase [ubiquinone] 1 beta subcomplex subunit 3 isoform X1 [Canis lupus familiaris]XP_038441259.1 NADH dehydrogenase [ubiquinone] 1 beta subcomplex subunit 3 isoform X1 [Canis lupus familiaris]